MKFTTVFTLLTLSAVSVYAARYETNASRLARGLPPLPPTRRSRTWGARGVLPSSVPSEPRGCNTGPVQCCNTVTRAGNQQTNTLANDLDVLVPATSGSLVGLDCSPLSAVRRGGNDCATQPVCCENNGFNGDIVTDCTAINV